MMSRGHEAYATDGLDRIIDVALTGYGDPDTDRLRDYHISGSDDDGGRRGDYIPSLIDIAAGCAEIRSRWTPAEKRRRFVGLAPEDNILFKIPVIILSDLTD